MIDNPIVDEVHRIREEILAEYGGDLHAVIRDDQAQTEELAKAGRVVVTRGPRPVQPSYVVPQKVGPSRSSQAL